MEQRLAEINARKLEIRAALPEANAEAMEGFKTELETLEAEERSIQEKIKIAEKINIGEVRGKIMEKPVIEVKAVDTEMEYRKAFMEYVLRGKVS